MDEFNPNPNVDQPTQTPEPKVLRGIPDRNRVWLAIRGITLPLLLVIVVVGSFLLSFNIGRHLLLPLQKETFKPLVTGVPETPANIAELQQKSDLEASLNKRLAAVLKEPVVGQKVVAVVSGQYYKVQAGFFSSKSRALTLSQMLQTAGFESFVRQVKNGWRVQAGAYKRKAQAQKLQRQLKAKDFSSVIIVE